MLSYIENLEIISSFHKKSKQYGKIQNRLSHAFIFKINGSAEYFFDGKSLKVNAGDVIFLPKGASYEYISTGGENNLYTSVNFNAKIENADPTVYSLENFHETEFFYQSFTEYFKFGGSAEKYKCISAFYNFLSYISKIEELVTSNKDNCKLIAPAIEYIKAHIYDSDFKISRLHVLCGISGTYFRRIFVSRFNMTPQEYILTKRITHAKSILESCDFESIKEVAESVGYSDSLYFSKAFKKYYGYSPSSINR